MTEAAVSAKVNAEDNIIELRQELQTIEFEHRMLSMMVRMLEFKWERMIEYILYTDANAPKIDVKLLPKSPK